MNLPARPMHLPLRVRRDLPVAVFLGLLALLAPRGLAEPYLAVREGLKCSACHVNPTGGGMRNRFGATYGQTRLVLRRPEVDADSSGRQYRELLDDPLRFLRSGPLFDRWLNDRLAVGGDLRWRASQSFQDPAGDRSSFDLRDARVYAAAELYENALQVYVDETLGPGGSELREAFGIWRDLPWRGYVKGGRILRPFGLRVVDDQAFIRRITGINFETPDVGVEVGFEPGPYSLSVAVTNGAGGGADVNVDKEVSLVQSWVTRHFRVGSSFNWNKNDQGRRQAWGLFSGIHAGRISSLSEVDLILDDLVGGSDTRRQIAAYLETDILVVPGVNLKNTLEWVDPDGDVGDDEGIRVGAGIEVFLAPSLRVEVLWQGQDNVPQKPVERTDFLFLEVQVYV